MNNNFPPATSHWQQRAPGNDNHQAQQRPGSMPFRLNRFVVISVLFNLGLCASITLVAMIWCIMNIRRQYQGPLLMQLSHTHGVHLFDAMVAVVEFGLILLLTLSLVYTASRGQRQPDS